MSINVKEIRKSTGLSQVDFANKFGISRWIIRSWEQGRRKPQGASLCLLMVIKYNPQIVLDALNEFDQERLITEQK